MADSADLLGLPGKRSRLHALASVGVLSADQLERGLAALGLRPSRASWSAYLYWHALIVGVVLVVAGTIFFVAANWSALPGFARMGLVGGAMVAATLVGGWLGDSLTGRAVSLLGGLLFGPLLAVYGQVYQTGADAWELYAIWAAVLIGYALLVRFVGTWVVALLCGHVAWFSWIEQELGGELYAGRHAWILATLAIVDALVVVLAERLLDGREREILVHTAGVFGLGVVLPFGIVAVIDEPAAGAGLGLAVLLAGLGAIWLIYRWRRPRLGMLVAFAAVVTILVTTLVGRVLLDELDTELFGVALLGGLVCAMVWGFTRWLLRWRREQPVVEVEPSTRSAVRRRPKPTLRELFGEIAANPGDPRLATALGDADGSDAPLIVRVFTVIGTWIGAAMLAMIFAALEIHEVVPLAVLLAVGLFVGATALARRPRRSLVLTQVIWAMALGAHGLLLGACAELDVDAVAIAAIWTLLNLGLLFAIRVPSFALASAICAVGFATWLCVELELAFAPLWVALPVAGIATAVWVFETPTASRLGRTWSALAYGLPLGVVGPLTLLSLEDRGAAMVAQSWAAGLATLVLVGLIGGVLWQAQREQGEAIERRTHVIGAIAVLFVLAARHVPGLSLALLWLLLAHLRKSVELHGLALIQLAGFLLFFYYQLETTLLLKSVWVISTGAVLLLGAWLGRVRPELDASGQPRAERRSRWWSAIGLSLATTAMVVGASVHEQRILAHGQTVLLPLAPVDPRSLMQGDYMILRYTLEEQMGLDPFDVAADEAPELPRHGRLVIVVDERDVGRFVRIDDGRELGEGERLLEYRLREGWGGRVRIGAESFLFEETSAELYAGARYAELVVADDGEVVLVGLRDADLQPLGLRLH